MIKIEICWLGGVGFRFRSRSMAGTRKANVFPVPFDHNIVNAYKRENIGQVRDRTIAQVIVIVIVCCLKKAD